MVSSSASVPKSGPGHLDGEAERGDEVVVVGGPLGAGGDAGHPDPVPGELRERSPTGRRRARGRGPVRSWSGSSSTRTDSMSSGRGRPGAATARKVASIVPARQRRSTAVSMSNSVTTSSSISGCARWKPRIRPAGAIRAAITSTRSGRRPGRTDASARSATRSSSRAWGRNACPSMVSSAPRGGAGEQPHAEVLLQRGDALGDGLLGDRQVGGGFLELARVRDGDEGAYGFEIHADPP